MTTPPTPVSPHIHLPSTPLEAVFEGVALAAALPADEGALVILAALDESAEAGAEDDMTDETLDDEDVEVVDWDELPEAAPDTEADPDEEDEGTWTVTPGNVVEAIEHCCR